MNYRRSWRVLELWLIKVYLCPFGAIFPLFMPVNDRNSVVN
ncbi:hypothetical protein HMPREF1861_01430 [Corynebacterium kroppenstedtii]|nr:hypothetical protein HMPREF1861_01430 [Corynebacterium kroppenstedtii]